MDVEQQFRAMAQSMETVAPHLAAAQRAYYDALVEEGFSEDEAMELLKETSIESNS